MMWREAPVWLTACLIIISNAAPTVKVTVCGVSVLLCQEQQQPNPVFCISGLFLSLSIVVSISYLLNTGMIYPHTIGP